MKNFFTSDWHAGELSTPNTHSFLRPKSTEKMVEEWIKICNEKITEDDVLYFVGDLVINLSDLEVYKELPKCKKILIMGDKEYANKKFSKEEFLEAIIGLGIFDEILESTKVLVGDVEYFVSHKPTECLEQDLPSICGHVHGVWRTQAMPNNQPIINVGIDAWGSLVTEEFITHQYNAINKGYYDTNCIVKKW